MQEYHRPLHDLFSRVPRRYDLLNRLLTWRLDERWRGMAAREILKEIPRNVVDLACGTGDLALRLARTAPESTTITAVDFVPGMLEIARKKAAAANLANRMNFVLADAASLPFADKSVDVVGISFALRNLTYKDSKTGQYLAEILRVLAPGGRLVAVETSQPSSRLLRVFFRVYLKLVVAGLGARLSEHAPAYRYLAESARNFYTPAQLAELLRGAGFTKVDHRSILWRVAGITTGTKMV